MRRRRIFAFIGTAAAAATLAMSGQASGQTVVTSGAFCSPAGATGVTSTGIPMTCTTAPGDDRNRWRATSEVTTTTSTAVTTTTVASTTSTTAAGAQTTTTVASTGVTTTTAPSVAASPSAPRPLALTG